MSSGGDHLLEHPARLKVQVYIFIDALWHSVHAVNNISKFAIRYLICLQAEELVAALSISYWA